MSSITWHCTNSTLRLKIEHLFPIAPLNQCMGASRQVDSLKKIYVSGCHLMWDLYSAGNPSLQLIGGGIQLKTNNLYIKKPIGEQQREWVTSRPLKTTISIWLFQGTHSFCMWQIMAWKYFYLLLFAVLSVNPIKKWYKIPETNSLYIVS